MKLGIINHLLGGNTPQTNEEYRKYLKRKTKIYIGLIVAGILMGLFGGLGEYWLDVPVDDYVLGLYLGVGAGIVLGSVLRLIKNKHIYDDEEKLKQARLEMGDERIQEISSKAFRMAAWIMIIVMYVGILIGGIFYPVIAKIMCSMLCLFLVSYTICYRIFEARM